MPCNCASCLHFIQDKIGFGQGLGACKQYAEYKAKGASEKALRAVLRRLGNRPDFDGELFWGAQLVDRECEKYEVKNDGN